MPSREMDLLKAAMHPINLLDIMEALGRLHFGDSRHLLWVRVYAMMGEHILE
jgi:hypothetical protein